MQQKYDDGLKESRNRCRACAPLIPPCLLRGGGNDIGTLGDYLALLHAFGVGSSEGGTLTVAARNQNPAAVKAAMADTTLTNNLSVSIVMVCGSGFRVQSAPKIRGLEDWYLQDGRRAPQVALPMDQKVQHKLKHSWGRLKTSAARPEYSPCRYVSGKGKH